ncbi:MAG: branched-chain amino acid ABC transporter substrate-binding protein [Candidatus Sericytochromatia bacterium]
MNNSPRLWRTLIPAICCTLLCSLLTGCFESSVKIGVALPLSGASTPRGQEILNGVLMAVEDVNHYGGIHGHQVELLIEDDQDSPAQGRKAAEALIHKHVLGVVGHYSSDVTLEVLPIYIQAKTALVSPSVTLSRIPSEGSIFFRTLGSNEQQAQAAVKFIHASGFSRIAIVRNDSLYGRDLSERLQASLKAYSGIRRMLLEDGPDCLERLRRQLPELVFYAGGYQDAAQFLQRLRESGQQPAFMGGNTLRDSEFIRLAGLGQVKEVWITDSGLPPDTFLTRYRQRFGQPGPFSAFAYDAARLLLSAAEQAKSLEPESVRAELAQRKLYQGLTGAILLNPHARDISQSKIGILTVTPDGRFLPAQAIRPLFIPAGQRAGNWARQALK